MKKRKGNRKKKREGCNTTLTYYSCLAELGAETDGGQDSGCGDITFGVMIENKQRDTGQKICATYLIANPPCNNSYSPHNKLL